MMMLLLSVAAVASLFRPPEQQKTRSGEYLVSVDLSFGTFLGQLVYDRYALEQRANLFA